MWFRFIVSDAKGVAEVGEDIVKAANVELIEAKYCTMYG